MISLKKKYIISLTIVGMLLISIIILVIGYGLWLSINNNENHKSQEIECLNVYYSDSSEINLFNIKKMSNESGKETSPYTITISNKCKEEQTIQLRLNILNGNTVDLSSLSIMADGYMELPSTLYESLNATKSKKENIVNSKLISTSKIAPNESIRTNIKIWFDERKGKEIKTDDVLKAQFEVVNTKNIIKYNFAETIINNLTSTNYDDIDFSNPEYFRESLVKHEEDGVVNYQFRGPVKNNYVLFANKIWRVVGINSNQTVKIILNESAGISSFSDYSNEKDYAGIKYIYNDELIDNKINTLLLNWYDTNIKDLNLDSYVVSNMFCNDSNYTSKNYQVYFNAYDRLVSQKKPTNLCEPTKADFGGPINQKIGLITADEVAIAGGVYGINNFNYYLYSNDGFLTITPYSYVNYNTNIFSVNESGAMANVSTNNKKSIRPVINLNSTITVSGNGSIDDPYTIDTE